MTLAPAAPAARREGVAREQAAASLRVSTAAADSRRADAQVRMLCGLLLAVVLLQRFVVPLGGSGDVPLLLPLALGVAAFGMVRRLMHVDPLRAGLVLLALGGCATTGMLSVALGRPDTSLMSLLYLVSTYIPFVLVLTAPPGDVVERTMAFLSRLAAVVGAAAVTQILIQPLGVPYSDVLRSVVPDPFLTDAFNTSYPIVWNSPIYKSNAWVFLEPSICSQFLGLAFVVMLFRGRPGWPLLLVAAGIMSTVAGTGMVLAALGCVLLAVQRGLRALRPLLLPVAVVLSIVAVTPVGPVLAERVTETSDSDSSGSLRFVQPFQVFGGAWLEDVDTAVLGAGPGASERLAVRVAGSTALQQPVPLKLLYDYGALATVYFLICMTWVVMSRAPVPIVAVGLLAAWLVLNSALLMPVIIVLMWSLTSLLSGARPWTPDTGPSTTLPEERALHA